MRGEVSNGVARVLRGAPFVAAAFCASSPRAALAYEANVSATLDAQAYSIESPYGSPYVYRRRYTSTLGLDLDDIEGERRKKGARLLFRSRLRVDADFGQDDAERDAQSNRFVPGLQQAPLDVMYAYLEGRGFADGLLGFRLGRQYLIDALGYWSFDGGLLEVSLPAHLVLSGFAGFEQRTGLPMLASARFSGDGVWRGMRSGLEDRQDPAFLQDDSLAPAFGAAIETSNVSFLHARLSYRKVENRSTVLVTPFFDPTQPLRFYSATRTSSERLGTSARVDLAKVGSLSGRAAYDLYNRAFSDADLNLDWFARPSVTLGADIDYFFPTFDADSIFNFFTRRGMTTSEARVSVTPRGSWDAAASAGLRWFSSAGDPATFGASEAQGEPSHATNSRADVLGRANGRYRFGPGSVALDFAAESGEAGHSVGGDLTTRRVFAGGRYDSMLVASLYDFRDPLRPTRSATSFSYVVGAGLRPGPELLGRGRLGVEWEHTMNRLVGQRFRLLFTLDFTVLK